MEEKKQYYCEELQNYFLIFISPCDIWKELLCSIARFPFALQDCMFCFSLKHDLAMRMTAALSLAAITVPPDFLRCINTMFYSILPYFSIANKYPTSWNIFSFTLGCGAPFLKPCYLKLPCHIIVKMI